MKTPPGYYWTAVDGDGSLYAYTNKPDLGDGLWIGGGHHLKLASTEPDWDSDDWRNSLRRVARPSLILADAE